MTQQAVVMPSLAAPNRIELPNQPAPYGAPAPEIGPVLQVASDVDQRGYSTEAEFGPTPLGRRIGLAICIAIVAYGTCFFISMLALGGKGSVAALPALLGTAALTFWYWHGAGKTSRYGSCVYLGADGFTRIQLSKRSDEITTQLFRDEMATLTSHTRVFIGGTEFTSEVLQLFHPDGTWAASLVGAYDDFRRPNQHAMLVRTAIKVMTMRRLAAAQHTLAQGGQLVFAIADTEVRSFQPLALRPTGAALVLEAGVLSYFKAPNTQPLRIDRRSVQLSLRHGYVDLTMRESGVVLGSFKRETLVNFELLEALV